MHFDRERVTRDRHGIILIRRTSQRCLGSVPHS